MGKRQTFVIDGQHFPTKESLAAEIRQRIAVYDNHTPFMKEDERFFYDLLQLHPQADVKIGCGVTGFHIIENPVYTHCRTLILHRVDGSYTDWSWRECLSPTPHERKVRSAFRVLLEPQMIAIKQRFFDVAGGSACCPITGALMVFTSAHVDHIPPTTFESLFLNFIHGEHLTLSSVHLSSEGKDNVYQDTLADAGLAMRWLAFHDRFSNLRVISARANLSDVRKEWHRGK